MELPYQKYMQKANIDKAINTLLGILEGVAADKTVSAPEWKLLTKWIEDNRHLIAKHPYSEIIPPLIRAMSDGKLDGEEHQDIVWLCNRFRATQYYNFATADIQRLQAILTAIASDGVISQAEIETLAEWLVEHDHLRKCWPYDEVDSLVTAALADRWIDPAEHKALLEYFNSFSSQELLVDPVPASDITISGICAVAPVISFENQRFCFTGESSRATRSQMTDIVIGHGGIVITGVSPKLNYLIVGSDGNPCWAYACYGRKIEKAMQLRREGANIVVAHEADFFDAL